MLCTEQVRIGTAGIHGAKETHYTSEPRKGAGVVGVLRQTNRFFLPPLHLALPPGSWPEVGGTGNKSCCFYRLGACCSRTATALDGHVSN